MRIANDICEFCSLEKRSSFPFMVSKHNTCIYICIWYIHAYVSTFNLSHSYNLCRLQIEWLALKSFSLLRGFSKDLEFNCTDNKSISDVSKHSFNMVINQFNVINIGLNALTDTTLSLFVASAHNMFGLLSAFTNLISDMVVGFIWLENWFFGIMCWIYGKKNY